MSTITGKIRLMRPLFRFAAVVAAAALAPVATLAHDYALKSLRIEHPTARPTPPGARTGGVYFTIRNDGRAADRLTHVASPAARAAELHSMQTKGNMMKMRAVDAVDVPAGSSVTFAPGDGYHVMLLDIRHSLSAGDEVPLTLTFEKSGQVDIVAHVEAPAASGGGAHRH